MEKDTRHDKYSPEESFLSSKSDEAYEEEFGNEEYSKDLSAGMTDEQFDFESIKLVRGQTRRNVGEVDRIASALGGIGLSAYGLQRMLSGRKKRSGSDKALSGLMALVGGYFLYKGISGHCYAYDALGVNTDEGSLHGYGFLVEKSVVINRSPEDVYKFWSNFENLPRFMSHLKDVRQTGDHRWHWIAEAPLGSTVEWEADVIYERPNELISWRSLEGSDVDHVGSVRFSSASRGRHTVVRVSLEYDPPMGSLGRVVAKLFQEAPEQQIESDLKELKRLLESESTS